jgi:hypothetical protein
MLRSDDTFNYNCTLVSNKSPLRWPVYGSKNVADDITAEINLSGLNVTASHPDIQKIRITGFFFENWLHWQFEVGEKLFYQRLF